MLTMGSPDTLARASGGRLDGGRAFAGLASRSGGEVVFRGGGSELHHVGRQCQPT